MTVAKRGRPRKKSGVPSNFTWKLAGEICDYIANGKSIPQILKLKKEDPAYPRHPNTIYRWARDNEKFREMYYMAQEDRAEHFVEELMDLCEEVRAGDIDTKKAEFIARRVEWIAGKFKPSRFSDKVEQKDVLPQQVILQMDFGGGRIQQATALPLKSIEADVVEEEA